MIERGRERGAEVVERSDVKESKKGSGERGVAEAVERVVGGKKDSGEGVCGEKGEGCGEGREGGS